MSLLVIDRQLCKKCGLCATICVDDVFEKAVPGEYPNATNEKDCVGCGHCVAICPVEAISHNKLRGENVLSLKGNNRIDADVMERFLRSKRSVRHFKKAEVEKEKITRILNIAQQAPSDTNSQDRHYIVLTDRQKINELENNVVKYYKTLMFWMKYPVRKFLSLFTPNLMNELEKVLPDFGNMVRKYENGEKPVFRNAPCVVFIYGSKGNLMGKDNCIIAQDYLMLQAESMGLGSCMIGYATGAPDTLAKYLKIPKDQMVYCAIILGYPEYSMARGVDRKDPEVAWL